MSQFNPDLETKISDLFAPLAEDPENYVLRAALASPGLREKLNILIQQEAETVRMGTDFPNRKPWFSINPAISTEEISSGLARFTMSDTARAATNAAIANLTQVSNWSVYDYPLKTLTQSDGITNQLLLKNAYRTLKATYPTLLQVCVVASRLEFFAERKYGLLAQMPDGSTAYIVIYRDESSSHFEIHNLTSGDFSTIILLMIL